MHKEVTCKNCGWIHFEVSRVFAEVAIEEFNKYFYSLDLQKRVDYYGDKGASLVEYEVCDLCGGSYKDFRDTTDEELKKIYGSTLGPIINREE